MLNGFPEATLDVGSGDKDHSSASPQNCWPRGQEMELRFCDSFTPCLSEFSQLKETPPSPMSSTYVVWTGLRLEGPLVLLLGRGSLNAW